MASDNLTKDVGQETEKMLSVMNLGQFAMLLDNISAVESLISQGDRALTVEALVSLIYHEAGNRSIDGYKKYADANEQGDSINFDGYAAKLLLDSGLGFNKRGEVVPIFPPNVDRKK